MEKSNIKAIIVAAGKGNRLMPLTNGKPKCLLEVGSKTILQRQLKVLERCGITNIVVVRGYKRELINYPDIEYCDDIHYKGILGSLFFAEKEMEGGFVFSYSDIICGKDIVKKLLETQGDIVLVVDTNWLEHYKGRERHPPSEAELVKVEGDKVVKIGKEVVKIDEAHGEFIGLAKFTTKGVEIIKEVYHDLINRYKKQDSFQNAKEFQKAYLTDFIQEIVDRGIEVRTADISSIWTEIDTDEDLQRAKKIWK